MSIRNLIEKNPALLALAMEGDVDGILEVINSVTVTQYNHSMIGPAGLAIVFADSPQTAAIACGVLETAAQSNPLMKALYNTFCTAGFDFSHEKTRDMIDVLFTGDLIPVGTALKSLGEWQVSPAFEVIQRDATEADVVSAISSLVFDHMVETAQRTALSLRGQDFANLSEAIEALKTSVGEL